MGTNTLPFHLFCLVLEQPPAGVGPATPASVNETLPVGTGSTLPQQPLSGAVSW